MTTKKLPDLDQFCGGENHYAVYGPKRFGSRVVMTDGIKYVADTMGAYWLFELTATILPDYRKEAFVSVKLTITDDGFILVLDDGNGNDLSRYDGDFTDFPADGLSFFAASQEDEQGGAMWVLMLPGEY